MRSYFLLSLSLLAALLAGCAPKAPAQPEQVKALEYSTPTSLPATSLPIDTPTYEVIPPTPPENCPITVQQSPLFVPPAPYDTKGFEGEFWYGSKALWTSLRGNGTWWALPHNPEGYTQKVFWWRDGYVWNQEPEPELLVTAERLDDTAPLVHASKATNAFASDIGSAMLVGMDLPTLGCWKITGQYGKAELSFVVWVAP